MLEGSVNLRDCEIALKQIDVYSLGLVIWELAMRCKDFYKIEDIPEYRSAYEAELGSCPNFDQMRNLVLQQSARPKFSETDLNFDDNLCLVRDICQDLWDHDPDARVSSSCVEDRMMEMALELVPADLSPTTSRPLAVFIEEMRMTDFTYTSKIKDTDIELDNSTKLKAISSQDKDFECIRIENVSGDDHVSCK